MRRRWLTFLPRQARDNHSDEKLKKETGGVSHIRTYSCGSCSSVAFHSQGGHLRNIRARLQTAQVCTQRLSRHFVILKPIDLPRQARDKRKENLNKARFFSQRDSPQGRTRPQPFRAVRLGSTVSAPGKAMHIYAYIYIH